MIIKSLGRGVFPDPAWRGRDCAVVVGINPLRFLRVTETGELFDVREWPTNAYFPRTDGTNIVYSDGNYFQCTETVPPQGTPAGNCPVAIGPNGTIYYQTLTLGNYRVSRLMPDGTDDFVRIGAPTGLWKADDFGHVQLWDECYKGGTTHTVRGVTVSERKDNDGCTVTIDGKESWLCGDKWVYWPRVTVRDDGLVAIAWSDQKTGTGAWLVIATQDELKWLPLPNSPSPTIPTTPTTPTVPPTQEFTPVQLKDAEKAVLVAFAAAYPHPAATDDDARREWVLKLAQTFKAKFTGLGWGTKKSSANNPQTKDVICYESAGRLLGWDVVNGTDPLTTNVNAESMDLTGQVFIEVEARDWLTSLPPTPTVPTTPTEPVPSTLEARVAKIEAFLNSWGKA